MIMLEYMNEIPLDSQSFQKIIKFYLFECPVRLRKPIPKKDRNLDDPQSKYKYLFKKVSKRGVTFDERGLDGASLNTLRAAMKRVTGVILKAVDDTESVSTAVANMEGSEYIVIKRNESSCSITEGYFYCIRNALAHGDFNIVEKVYFLKNEDKGSIKGLARLTEKSLLAWIDLVELNVEEIRSAGR